MIASHDSQGRLGLRRWANGVGGNWGQTDLTGFYRIPGFPFSALSGYALYL